MGADGSSPLCPSQVIEAHYARVLGISPLDTYAPNASEEVSASPVPDTGPWVGTEGTLAPPDDGAEDLAASSHVLTMYWSLSVSVFAIGGMVSSFTVGWIGDRLGR